MATKKTAYPKQPKDVKKWTAYDFLIESSRIQQDTDLTSDGVVCGAMMLAALREGVNLPKLAKATGIRAEILKPFYTKLVSAGCFKGFEVSCNWWPDDGTGGLNFIMDTMVGLGLMERAA